MVIQSFLSPGLVVHAYIPSYSEGESRRMTRSRPVWAKVTARPCSQKQNKHKTEGGVAQVAEHLPISHRVQAQFPLAHKKSLL
jgi:hypothetical protein